MKNIKVVLLMFVCFYLANPLIGQKSKFAINASTQAQVSKSDLGFLTQPVGELKSDKVATLIKVNLGIGNLGGYTSLPSKLVFSVVSAKYPKKKRVIKTIQLGKLAKGQKQEIKKTIALKTSFLPKNPVLIVSIQTQQKSDYNLKNNTAKISLGKIEPPIGSITIDLSLKHLKVNKQKVMPGEKMVAGTILTNETKGVTSQAKVIFYLSTQPRLTKSAKIIGKTPVKNIKAGQSLPLQKEFVIPTTKEGIYYIHAICKTKGKDMNFKNNKVTTKIFVKSNKDFSTTVFNGQN